MYSFNFMAKRRRSIFSASRMLRGSFIFLILLALNAVRAEDPPKTPTEVKPGVPPQPVSEQNQPKTPEDLEREALIAKFTQKMKEANYPEKFKQAGEEFGVPPEILMGISFAETRWEHLQWPEGETVSPENGMPRPYGIMSLWDNDYFGHTLNDAAKLIGKSPEELKKDPLQNMRGAAAFLKKIYDENPKPPVLGKEGEMESWRAAIAKYSGIPEPELNMQHAFDVYDWLSQGYDQYGIKYEKVPNLKLDEMYAEVKKVKEEARAKQIAKLKAEGRWDDEVLHSPDEVSQRATNAQRAASAKIKTTPVKPVVAASGSANPLNKQNWILWLAGLALVALVLSVLLLRKKNPAEKK
ncbi:MAG: hypothetical protein ACR2H1_06435 [Limisphaerales bacterium]